MRHTTGFYRGCLIGGAIGDALGWPVEFKNYDQIVQQHGPNGIQDLHLSPTGKVFISSF